MARVPYETLSPTDLRQESKCLIVVPLTRYQYNSSNEFRHRLWSSFADIDHTVRIISFARIAGMTGMTTYRMANPPA